MKIVIKESKYTPWEQIKVGDVFRWKGECFIRMFKFVNADGIECEGVCLDDGETFKYEGENDFQLAKKITIEFD